MKGPQGGIYVITVDGLGNYYGESDNIPRRWARHRKQLANDRHHCVKLRRAWRDLGPAAFHFHVYERSQELTENKALRRFIERNLILADPMNLNTAGSEAKPITASALPLKDVYSARCLYIERVPRTGLARVRTVKGGMLLGIETIEGKFRAGYFHTDMACRLERIKGPCSD
jgi:hypothetical protein